MSKLRTKLIRLAYQNPDLRPDLLPLLKNAVDDPFSGDWLQDLLSREPTPEEKALSARSKAVTYLMDGIKRRQNQLSRAARSSSNLAKEKWLEDSNGKPWASTKGAPRIDFPDKVRASVETWRKAPRDGDFNSSDVESVWFEQEYGNDARGFWGRHYNKVGYTTRGGRDVVVATGPWDQGRLAFTALAKGLDKVLSKYQAESDSISRDLQRIWDSE